MLDKYKKLNQDLLSSSELAEYEKAYFSKELSGKVSLIEMSEALEKLSQMLAAHYGKAPIIIIIDEYDTPIQEGYSKDFLLEFFVLHRRVFSVG